MRELGLATRALSPASCCRTASRWRPGYEATARSIWPSIYPALLELVRQHRSTIVFVNNRRLAERLAVRLNELAERDDRARPPRLARARAAGRDRGAPEGRADPVPRRDLVARARDRHGRRRPRDPGREPEVGRARPAAGRPRRPRPRRRLEGAHLPQVPRRPARVAPSSRRRCARARSRRRRSRATRSTCSRSRSSRSAPTTRSRSTTCTTLVRGAYPFADLSRAAARERARHARRPLPVRRVRRAAAADRLGPHRGRRQGPAGRAAARGHERGHDPRPRPLRRLPGRRRRPRRRARRGDGLRGAAGADVHARRLDLADRGDHARPRARLARARRAGSRPVLEGRGRRPAVRARREDRTRLARDRRALGREGARAPRRRLPPRPARGEEPAHLPARAGGRDRGRRALRPHDRRRALPRRDRRLARSAS